MVAIKRCLAIFASRASLLLAGVAISRFVANEGPITDSEQRDAQAARENHQEWERISRLKRAAER
jgi:hypothetical protein